MRRLATVQRVEWFRLIADLKRQGIPPAAIAEQCGVGRTTVLGWGQGAEPKHFDGEALIALWCDVLQQEPAAVPRQAKPYWQR